MVVATAAVRAQIPAIEELADERLRTATAEAWAEALRLSPFTSLDEVPQSPLMVDRSLLAHVNEVDDICLHLINTASAGYRLQVDRDVALATAILHDVDKPILYRRVDGGFAMAEGRALTDHGPTGADLLVRCGVPQAIADLVRVHSPFASDGLPATPEGTIVHYADMLSNDLACLQWGAAPIHTSTRLVHR
jgi:putative nucleotidyltransferase with HDIG domain